MEHIFEAPIYCLLRSCACNLLLILHYLCAVSCYIATPLHTVFCEAVLVIYYYYFTACVP
jgi:hypothetical protein